MRHLATFGLAGALLAGPAAASPVTQVFTTGAHTFTAPVTTVYTIEALGGSGGGGFKAMEGTVTPTLGGVGARAVGSFRLSSGTKLSILAAGAGASARPEEDGGGSGGGGGGSFVWITLDNTPLVVAGGGGGGEEFQSGLPAAITADGNGRGGTGTGAGAGGAAGLGGAGSSFQGGGAGGGGFMTAGDNALAGPDRAPAQGGAAALAGGAGGAARPIGGAGGFGGGGGGSGGGGGGGGGYGGGGGGGGPGGGGGSFINTGLSFFVSSEALALLTTRGDGRVTISWTPPVDPPTGVPAPAGAALFALALAGLLAARRRG
jgi:hypothetical protein